MSSKLRKTISTELQEQIKRSFEESSTKVSVSLFKKRIKFKRKSPRVT